MTRVLIASGNAKTGIAAISALKRLGGVTVVAGARDVAKAEAGLKAKGADEVVAFDFDHPDVVSKALQGVDRIFLVQAAGGAVDLLVKWTETVVQAATKPGSTVKFISRLSSAGSDPNAQGLLKFHGLADKLLKESGLQWATVNPNFFTDNWEHQADSIKRGKVLGAAGEGKVAYVTVNDIGEVAAAVLHDPAKFAGKAYHLSGPTAVSDAEVVQAINHAAGKNAAYINLDLEQYKSTLKSFGIPDATIAVMAGLEFVKANNWASAVGGGVKEVLGREPTSVQQWAQLHAAKFQ